MSRGDALYQSYKNYPAPPFKLQWGSRGHPGHRSGPSRIRFGGVEKEAQSDGQENCHFSGATQVSGLKKGATYKQESNRKGGNIQN